MKLRNKLIIGTVLISAAALAVSCTLLLRTSRAALLQSAADYTRQEAGQLIIRFSSRVGGMGEDLSPSMRDTAMQYYFVQESVRSASDSEYVLQSDTAVLYNNSGVDPSDLRTIAGTAASGTDAAASVLETGGKMVAAASATFLSGGRSYVVSVVRDLSGIRAQLRGLAVKCILISSLITLLAAAAAAVFLKRSLHPLDELRENAEAIAAGNYDRRIGTTRRDELGILANSFDAMAGAVRGHIREVEAASEARNLLLHALAHEMRTPVTAIRGYAYALQTARLSQEQRTEAIDFIGSESLRLSRLSEKLAGLVGLDHVSVSASETDLPAWKAHLAQLLKDIPGLSLDLPEKGTLAGDPDLLTMLVVNLCENAAKAGADRIEVRFRDGVLSVRDDGCGIPEDQLELIMQPFYRGDASRGSEGFGLGLALCSRIAQVHGSRLTVHSVPGTGTEFSVDLYSSFTGS